MNERDPVVGWVVIELVVCVGQSVAELDALHVSCPKDIYQVIDEHTGRSESSVCVRWVLLASSSGRAAWGRNLAPSGILQSIEIAPILELHGPDPEPCEGETR